MRLTCLTRNAAATAVLLVGSLTLTSGCADECDSKAETCDIRDATCQEAIMAAVSCLRGGDAKLPAVTVVTEEELGMRMRQGQELSLEDEITHERASRGLALFELAPRGYDVEQADDDVVSEIAAAYFSDTKEILVVDRGQPLDDEGALTTFAHELVHALQDASYGLIEYRKRWVTNLDSSLAVLAVIEGEAVLYQSLVNLRLRGLSPHEVDWEGYFQQWRGETLEQAEQDPAPVNIASLRFPYSFGGAMVTQYWLAGGRRAVDTLVAAPPLSTREVMFGVSPQPGESNGEDLLDRAVPQLTSDYQRIEITTLGAWVARIFAARMGVPLTDRLAAASASVNDVFVVQADAKQDVVVASWRVRVDDGVSPDIWPGLEQTSIYGWSDDKHHEAVLIASEETLDNPRKLAWSSAEQAERATLGLATALMRPAHSKRSRQGCRVRLPRLDSFVGDFGEPHPFQGNTQHNGGHDASE